MASRKLYLRIEHCPQKKPSNEIQQLLSEVFLRPPGKTPLKKMESGTRGEIPIDAMIIASHRAPRLGDIFSYRDILQDPGPQYLLSSKKMLGAFFLLLTNSQLCCHLVSTQKSI